MPNDDMIDPTLQDEIRRLRNSEPSNDLWPGISRQIAPRGSRRTVVIGWPTALAAGIAIAITTSVSTAVLLHRVGGSAIPAPTQAQLANSNSLSTVAASFAPGDAALARAVDDLEAAVRQSMDQLDTEARSSVSRTLTMLDQAIAQAAERQIASPDDPRAAKYLTNTLRKKLQLLRTVSELTQRQT